MRSIKPAMWWKDAVGYQIWPTSFFDSNGDGIGDIAGITAKLDHLEDLGVNLLWLSPVYDSPQYDMGYDVSNYEDIWPKYGTLQEMENLISECKARQIRIVMDLVINHTSHEHAWFRESRKSRTNLYSDWYIWRDGKYGKDGTRHPPNNWRAAFGGSVWEYVAERDQYYLHLPLPQQPDLNWFNPSVRQAVFDSAIDFWLRRGIDGFRIDTVNFYWKDPAFPDAQITIPDGQWQPMEPRHIMNGPLVHDWLKELRSKIRDRYGNEVVLIGELPGTDVSEILKYISPESGELDMILDLDVFMADNAGGGPLHEFQLAPLPRIKDALAKSQGLLRAWTTAFTENHDHSRSIDRFGPGDGAYREVAGKLLALFLCTLSGTMFIYQGQEIGMTNVPSHWQRDALRDSATLRYLDETQREYDGSDAMQKLALDSALRFGRDNARTPVQWNTEPGAGFSSGQSWIPVNENYPRINVADQTARSDSIFAFWKAMIRLRREHSDCLIHGEFELLDRNNAKTMCYLKHDITGPEKMLVTLNFSSEAADIDTLGLVGHGSTQLVATNQGQVGAAAAEVSPLRPWEGRVYLLS